MRAFVFCLVVAGFLATVAPVGLAQEFKPYKGSKADEKASREASAAAPGKQSDVYTTADPFDKVYAFYKGLYKEYAMSHAPKLPSGQQLQWAFFILDGGKDLAHSNYWMKVQRPYVGGADGKDIRDLTIIQTVHSKL